MKELHISFIIFLIDANLQFTLSLIILAIFSNQAHHAYIFILYFQFVNIPLNVILRKFCILMKWILQLVHSRNCSKVLNTSEVPGISQ